MGEPYITNRPRRKCFLFKSGFYERLQAITNILIMLFSIALIIMCAVFYVYLQEINSMQSILNVRSTPIVELTRELQIVILSCSLFLFLFTGLILHLHSIHPNRFNSLSILSTIINMVVLIVILVSGIALLHYSYTKSNDYNRLVGRLSKNWNVSTFKHQTRQFETNHSCCGIGTKIEDQTTLLSSIDGISYTETRHHSTCSNCIGVILRFAKQFILGYTSIVTSSICLFLLLIFPLKFILAK